MRTLMLSAAVLAVTVLSGCGNLMGQATATEAAICQAWGDSLPTRSHADTQVTQDEIAVAYADFVNACQNWAHLVP